MKIRQRKEPRVKQRKQRRLAAEPSPKAKKVGYHPIDWNRYYVEWVKRHPTRSRARPGRLK